MSFIFPLFSDDLKYPLDYNKLDKARSLFEESWTYAENGKSVKSQRAEKEAKTILNSIFKNHTIIVSTDKCYFEREEFINGFGYSFKLSCIQSIQDWSLSFTIQHLGDKKTSDNILEKFEDSKSFNGKIQVIKNSIIGTYTQEANSIEVYCNIIDIKPVQIEKIEAASNDNNN